MMADILGKEKLIEMIPSLNSYDQLDEEKFYNFSQK
jgi:hypothetical protein